MKHYLLIILIFSTGAFAKLRLDERCNSCNNCNQKPDPLPGIMAQTVMNVFINGFIATQSPKNSQAQTEAVVEVLHTISNFLQAAVRKAEEENISVEEIIQIIEGHAKDPHVIRMISEQFLGQRLRMQALTHNKRA